MPTIEDLKNFHKTVMKKIQLTEIASLTLYQEKTSLTENEFKKHFEEFSKFYEIGLTHHFKVEEFALFPILKKKVEEGLIDELIEEHKVILSRFEEFEKERDHIKALEILKGIIDMSRNHIQKEEVLYSIRVMGKLSEEELKEIDRLAGKVAYPSS